LKSRYEIIANFITIITKHNNISYYYWHRKSARNYCQPVK